MITSLLAYCHSHKISPEQLDELVYEAATNQCLPSLNEESQPKGQEQILKASEEEASQINNEGMRAQLTFLLESWGKTKVQQAIQKL